MSEIEKQFFETFEIGKKEYTQCLSMGCKYPNKDCKYCKLREVVKIDYLQITDRILLKLICILRNCYIVSGENIDVLKERVLRACIKFQDELVTIDKTVKHHVQALFKENY